VKLPVPVLLQMLTSSTDRFESIRAEAPSKQQHLLVQAAKYHEGKHCKVQYSTVIV